MLWIDAKTDDDARRRGEAQWTPVWAENEDGSATAVVPGPEKVDGQFWGDAIKEVQNDPAARLAMAERQLPLPGAFSQMAVARRAIIRQLKKDGKPFDDELRQLHYWAALSSWSVPYSEVLREPGFNVLESTPYAKLAKLDLTYGVIGCDELLGLNKTDRKMMRDAWGDAVAERLLRVEAVPDWGAAASLSHPPNPVGLTFGPAKDLRSGEQIADRAQPEGVEPTAPAMFSGIVDHVAALAERREVARPVIAGIVV